MISGTDLSNKIFSHIYIEEDALGYEMTSRVLSSLPDSKIIKISHYKDVFNRRGQSGRIQEMCGKKLILAVNRGNLIYKGAPVCQDFGFKDFYYATSVMNCIFDCDYCFLKGMYNTSNVVLFVNAGDYRNEVEKLLSKGPVYLCISYDTDILPLDKISGSFVFWKSLAEEYKELTIEVRTKSSPSEFISSPRIIYAFTLSPSGIIDRFEHRTSSLKKRIESVNMALSSGASVRLCFDPMIYVPEWKKEYGDMFDEVTSCIDLSLVRDISIGTFRISKDYLKDLRRNCPCSPATLFPFHNKNNVSSYPDVISSEMISFAKEKLIPFAGEGKIYEY